MSFYSILILISISNLVKCINMTSNSNSNNNANANKARMVYSPSRLQVEVYKAIVGETVRLECPQANPTWFFRSLDPDAANKAEDLIVTRHGIINGDYKYKIMCHMTLKHKVIIINNIDFEEEGLYTCLYTLPTDLNLNDEANLNPVQYRYVFNVTVFTLINGLKMNLKPINMKTTSTINPFVQYNLKSKSPNEEYELIENSLTVRENEEFLINCIVDNSKPAADIKFSIQLKSEQPSLNNNQFSSYLTLPPLNYQTSAPTSIQTQSKTITKNSDYTYKTVNSVRLKPTREDHNKFISCTAENGFSNQKWENKKLLNVLYAPVCKDTHKFIYYVGINQTVNIECNILNSNPSKIHFEWNLNKIIPKLNLIEDEYSINSELTYQTYSNEVNFVTDGLTSRFKWKPTNMNHFGEIICKAKNEIGTTECVYEIKLGGVPNPPTECSYILKNTSAIISCQVGFHQGDPDIYCYLLRKSDNGVYKEHTRNRESCSFIVNDVNVNKLNEFWVYSSNRHGHNKDMGFYLSIGENFKQIEIKSNKNLLLVAGIVAICLFSIISCCFCIKLRKTDETDSVYDSDAYQINKSNQPISKQIKGVKLNNPNSNDIINDQKYVKIDLKSYSDASSLKLNQELKQKFIKKSISFTKQIENEDDMKESTPFFNKQGLLTTVTNTTRSVHSLNEGAKMVTFGNQNQNSVKNLKKKNNSVTTLETQTTNTTVTTSASGSSTGSTQSPTSNNDSESLNDAQINKSDKLTVSDQSFCQNKSNESFENKYLQKLCEEIEVSLNVDCECADDYSVNDFSGDYSFDHSIKSPVNLIELRKNFEQNIRNLRNNNNNNNNNSQNPNSINKHHHQQQQDKASNQIGVLV